MSSYFLHFFCIFWLINLCSISNIFHSIWHQLLLICPKNTHKTAPEELLETATKYRETMAHLEKSPSGAPAVYDYDTLLSKDLGSPAERHEKALSKVCIPLDRTTLNLLTK